MKTYSWIFDLKIINLLQLKVKSSNFKKINIVYFFF